MFFVVKLVLFFKNISFSLQKEEDVWKPPPNKKNNKIKVAKLLTYGGQVIDPRAHIYIYINMLES